MLRRLRGSPLVDSQLRYFSSLIDGQIPANSSSIPLFVSHQVGNEHEDIATLVDTFTAPGMYIDSRLLMYFIIYLLYSQFF